MRPDVDCLIIGGGPGGLTAAIYAARFRLTVQVVDAGASRAATIPCTRNHAGFPDGISGKDLVARMREQARKYGAQVGSGRVARLARSEGEFLASTGTGVVRSRAVLLATGVTNRRPPMTDELHAAALAAGRLRYCPVCDGFEVTDQDVGVIGTGAHGAREALFLRAYTSRVSLIAPEEGHALTTEEQDRLARAGVRILDGPAAEFQLEATGLSLSCSVGRLSFEAVYPALGSIAQSGLAAGLGADVTSDGCVKVDAHQRTSLPALYAAGDVALGLDQISHAMGAAGVAATTIRNDLAAIQPLLR